MSATVHNISDQARIAKLEDSVKFWREAADYWRDFAFTARAIGGEQMRELALGAHADAIASSLDRSSELERIKRNAKANAGTR